MIAVPGFDRFSPSFPRDPVLRARLRTRSPYHLTKPAPGLRRTYRKDRNSIHGPTRRIGRELPSGLPWQNPRGSGPRGARRNLRARRQTGYEPPCTTSAPGIDPARIRKRRESCPRPARQGRHNPRSAPGFGTSASDSLRPGPMLPGTARMPRRSASASRSFRTTRALAAFRHATPGFPAGAE